MKNRLNENGLSRELGWFSAATVVVANMVGTGIFTTSGLIMKQLGDPVLLLWCWAAGGVFALCGALCYGELGARFPNAGGEYVYLREAFGPWAGFLSGWISLIVGFSAPIAIRVDIPHRGLLRTHRRFGHGLFHLPVHHDGY
jgi:APA family basic amino acid/polyamine antiporter